MSLSLTSLPPELLGCIVANIESQPTRCNLARCSRQLYLCTIPHLYRQVTVQEEIRRAKQQKGNLETLASLLLRRPDLARLVRNFTLQTRSAGLLGSNEFEEPEESHDQAFATAANLSTLSNEEKIKCLGQFSHTHKSHHDLCLALLLPALLKVENVVLDLKIGCETYYLEEMVRKAGRRERPFDIQPPFEALTVFVFSHDFFHARNPGFIASLLKLPAIQKISGGLAERWFDENGDLTWLDSSSSPLTSLSLAVYKMNAEALGHILRASKALKTFSYKLCTPACISFAGIRQALQPHESCLESLSLESDNTHDEDKRHFRPMASFVNFNALKVFKVAAIFLETTENGSIRDSLINILPPNLETLHLTRFQSRLENLVKLIEALEHLLAQKSLQQMPSLKKIILENAYFFDRIVSSEVAWRRYLQGVTMQKLGTVAAAQGVSLKIKRELV